ncbi:MAG: DUF362 domain-containing protein [Sphaerochaeta sp.]|uniref:DUF362 domain-containing protein n=1 Tax=Sphaerochaeta sp. TaxID=1972642 RepID=UPI003D142160
MDEQVFVYKQAPDYSALHETRDAAAEFLFAQLDSQIKPGYKVILKPNFVKESHLYKPDEWEYVITHTEVIRLVLERVIKNLKNQGEICIIDAPQTDSDWDAIMQHVRLPKLVDELQKTTNVKISYFDLREERWFYKQGIIVKRKKLPGDPKGYVKVNLGENSEFFGKRNKDYYGADYDMNETKRYHNDKDNVYVISRTILECDVFINLPKLKTHKLTGITACLKNLVGTCVIKNSIPHHTIGAPETGGDKFEHETRKNDRESALKGLALKLLKTKNPLINYPFILVKKIAGLFLGSPQSDVVRNGSWHGNDTIWRATLDLNKILLYADKAGKMQNTPQRKYFALIDGIIGGEAKGPMEPDPKKSGVLIAGANPVYVDAVAATLMGFDYRKIPTIEKAYSAKTYPLTFINSEGIEIVSNNKGWEKLIGAFTYTDTMQFKPHFGWLGNIELLHNINENE